MTDLTTLSDFELQQLAGSALREIRERVWRRLDNSHKTQEEYAEDMELEFFSSSFLNSAKKTLDTAANVV